MHIIKYASLFLCSNLLLAAPVSLEFNILEGNFKYPQGDAGKAGHLLADQVKIISDYVSVAIDKNKDKLDATLYIRDRYFILDSRAANISSNLDGTMNLLQPINSLTAEDTYFLYNPKRFSIITSDFTLDYNDFQVGLNNIRLHCLNGESSKDKIVTQENVLHDCMNSASINRKNTQQIASVHYQLKNKLQADIKLKSAEFKSDGFSVDTQTLNFTQGSSSYSLDGLNAFCSKTNMITKFDPMELLNGCFKESFIKLQKFGMETPSLKLKADVELLNIAGSRLRLSAPTLQVTTNDDQTTITNLRLGCKKEISNVADITMDNIITNCLKVATINVSTINSADQEKEEQIMNELLAQASKGQIRKIKRENKKEDKAFSIDNLSDLELSSLDGKMTILGKVKVLFLNIKFKMEAQATYQPAPTQELNLKVENAIIAGFIPVKQLMLYLLNKFIPQGNIQVDGDNIIIKLGKKQ